MRITIIGHLPPPITGENLCRARLVDALKARQVAVRDIPRSAAWKLFLPADKVVIVNGQSLMGTFIDLLASQISLLLGRKVFWYFHNASWRRFAALPAWMWFGFSKKIHVVALTETIADNFIKKGYRASVLNNRIEHEFEKLAEPLPQNPPRRLIWMGFLSNAKGLDVALATFRILHAQDAAWRFDLYGSTAEANPHDPDNNINCHGFISGAAKVNAFCQGGVFILPSRYKNETQPVSIIEALCCGIPVAATNIGGVAGMINDGSEKAGELISDGNAEDNAKIIAKIMADYPAYSDSAKSIYAKKYSAGRFQKTVERIFL